MNSEAMLPHLIIGNTNPPMSTALATLLGKFPEAVQTKITRLKDRFREV